jgi:hypothetical protein
VPARLKPFTSIERLSRDLIDFVERLAAQQLRDDVRSWTANGRGWPLRFTSLIMPSKYWAGRDARRAA